MQLITVPEPGALQTVAVEAPVPEPHEVRIRVECVGLCGSDVEIFQGRRPPKERHGHPVLGHEVAGVIDQVGSGVTGLRVGDRVSAIEAWGALAEQVIAVPKNILRFDDRIPFADGCLLEVLPGVAMAAWCTGIEPGSNVLIVGQGLSGLLITRLVAHLGCGRLTVVDPDPVKLEIGLEFGATVAEQGFIEERSLDLAARLQPGFDVAIVATPGCVINAVVPLMRPRSRIVAYGGLVDDAAIDLMALHRRSVSVVKEGGFISGVREARSIWREALSCAYDGVLPLRRLRTHDFPMSAAIEAMHLRTDPSVTAIHVVLHGPPSAAELMP